MRKGQIKLVEKVKKIYGEQNNIVGFFENSEMSLNRLNSIYHILKCINKEDLFCLNVDELQEIIVKIDNHAEILYFALMYHAYKIHPVSLQEFEEVYNYIESPEYCKEVLDVYEYCETFTQAKAVIAKCPIGFALDDFAYLFKHAIIIKKHANIDEVMPYVMESLPLSKEQRNGLYAFSAWNWPLDLIRKYHYDIQSYKKQIVSIMLSGCNMQNFNNESWEQYDYYQNHFPISLEEKEKLQSLNLQSNIEIYRETFYKKVSFSQNAIKIHLTKYNSFKWNDNFKLDYGKKVRSDKIVYFYNTGEFYKEIKEKSILIPINLQEIIKLISVYRNMITDFLYPYFEMLAEDNKIYLDVLRIMRSTTTNNNIYYSCVPPIPLSEFKGKHTLKEVMTSYYKNTEDIPWNKVDIKICYAYFKLRKRIEPAGYTILWNWLNDHSELLTISDSVFTEILMNRFNEDSYWKSLNIYGENQKVTKETVRYTVQDYINFCHTLHKKIHLTFTSAKKMKEFHDDYAVIIENKHTPTITIPKNTKFKGLEKLLPADEFIWIKTKRKIIKEGVEMHHCVATYANLVNKDDCAIYGFIRKNNNRRYTIEFRKNRNGYYIEQMQSMCNREYAKEDYIYVQSLIV